MRNSEPRGFGSVIAEKTERAPSGNRRRLNDAWKSVADPAIVLYNFLEKNTNLTFWIAVGMVIGILLGQFASEFAVKIGPLGTVFIRMIQIIVVNFLTSLVIQSLVTPPPSSFSPYLSFMTTGASHFHDIGDRHCRTGRKCLQDRATCYQIYHLL